MLTFEGNIYKSSVLKQRFENHIFGTLHVHQLTLK